jgi:hypothetical protein|uniref:Uncharacterized protein n=1 Tax=Phaeodactylum tricornutum TaxID=2850 RepID=A0A8J9SMP8_PHATR
MQSTAQSNKSADEAPTNAPIRNAPDDASNPPLPSREHSTNDFVIREGFPALRLPHPQTGPWIDGDEPIPRQTFWADAHALCWAPAHLESFRDDCRTVFSARTRDDDQAYSAGVTYFCPSQMPPRCALEALALDIFRKHTEHLENGVMVSEQSGAEWWTLVLDDDDSARNQTTEQKEEADDEGDEVGLHFDADYGLEDQAPNLLLHPRVATVTYLTDSGAPTVVLNQRSPPPNDIEKKSLAGDIDQGWLSHPKCGKHIAFDGRLLHGAPATFFPELLRTPSPLPGNEPPTKKAKRAHQRITVLVNVWVNHCPLDAEPLDDDVCQQLKTPWEGRGKTDSDFRPPFVWNEKLDLAMSDNKTVPVTVKPSLNDAAGEEEVVICNRLVTAHYNASMEDLHAASQRAGLVALTFNQGALSLRVGEEVHSGTEEEQGSSED